MVRPKVSYIIVAYKSNDVIGDAINSIHAQVGEFDRELIIIDNYATQSCREIVKADDPTSQLIVNDTNRGYTAAINQGISIAAGDYLFFMNPDVRLTPECTARLIESLVSDGRVGAAAPQLLHDDGTIQYSVRNFPTFSTLIYEHLGLARMFPRSPIFGRWKNRYFDHSTNSVVQQPMASAFLVKRSVQESVGEWDERFFVFFSDVDICKRIIDAGHTIIFEPNAKAYHKVGGSTRKEGSWLIFESHRGFYRYLAKHELKGAKTILRPMAAAILYVSASLRSLAHLISGRSF